MDYSALDESIVEVVRTGNNSFTRIFESLNGVRNTAKGTVADNALLERRLQALRKKGRLVWTGSVRRSNWQLPEEFSA